MDLGHSRRAVCTGCACELIFAVVAVITNCALIGLAAKSADWLPEMTPVNAVLMFVAIEVSA